MKAALDRCGEELLAGLRERAAELARKQDGASQLAYALTTMFTSGSPPAGTDMKEWMAQQRRSQQKAFARARELDPANPEIAWLAAEHCSEGPDCAPVQQALLRAEPDNAAAWLRALAWARTRNDEAAMEDAFQRAAAARRYDTHQGSKLLAIMEAYAGVQTPASCTDPAVQEAMGEDLPDGRTLDTATFVEMLALATEHASVIYGASLNDMCKAEEGAAMPVVRRAQCQHVYGLMADDGMLMGRVIATSRLVELTRDAPDGPQWRERYRELMWMLEQQREMHEVLDPLATSDFTNLREALLAAGKWPPPADWLPESERARNLVLTGRGAE